MLTVAELLPLVTVVSFAKPDSQSRSGIGLMTSLLLQKDSMKMQIRETLKTTEQEMQDYNATRVAARSPQRGSRPSSEQGTTIFFGKMAA